MNKKPSILKINARDPEKGRIRKAAGACKKGKVIAFPTETVYIVGGRMSLAGTEKRLCEITGRSEMAPFMYHVGDWAMLDALGIKKTPSLRLMAQQFWPGPVTLIVSNLAGRKMGIRLPRNKIALALIRETGEPLITAGANVSGKPSAHTAHQVLEGLPDGFDCLIDGGKTEFKMTSTIVDLTGEMPAILRRGAQSTDVEKAVEKIHAGKCPRKRILIVCTGNVCRSPMAEGWLKRKIEERGLAGEIEVASCGTRARDGLPCTLEAETVMRSLAIDLSKFRSRLCRGGDLWSADLVIAMAPQHAHDITKRLPSVRERTITLHVEDPIGKGLDVFEKTLLDLETKLERYLDRILH
ncbi:MAG: L-threonylcarbamoyladenylate synthase [Candidatus Omnitrophota bacterium]